MHRHSKPLGLFKLWFLKLNVFFFHWVCSLRACKKKNRSGKRQIKLNLQFMYFWRQKLNSTKLYLLLILIFFNSFQCNVKIMIRLWLSYRLYLMPCCLHVIPRISCIYCNNIYYKCKKTFYQLVQVFKFIILALFPFNMHYLFS